MPTCEVVEQPPCRTHVRGMCVQSDLPSAELTASRCLVMDSCHDSVLGVRVKATLVSVFLVSGKDPHSVLAKAEEQLLLWVHQCWLLQYLFVHVYACSASQRPLWGGCHKLECHLKDLPLWSMLGSWEVIFWQSAVSERPLILKGCQAQRKVLGLSFLFWCCYPSLQLCLRLTCGRCGISTYWMNKCGNVYISRFVGSLLANIYLISLRSRYRIQALSNLIAALAINPIPFPVTFVV